MLPSRSGWGFDTGVQPPRQPLPNGEGLTNCKARPERSGRAFALGCALRAADYTFAMSHRLSPLAFVLLASCAPVLPPPLPPPHAPVSLPAADQVMPRPEEDIAYITKAGVSYSPEEVRLGLLSLFAERAKRTRLKGFSMVWGYRGRVYVNMKPPFDRVATLNLAAPELRPVLQIRAVRFDAAEIPAAQDRIGSALKPIAGGWGISYDYRSDRFEVMVRESQIGPALSLIPLDLADYVDVNVGEMILAGSMVTSKTVKVQR